MKPEAGRRGSLPRTAIVAGGGLAGLAATLRLVDAGVRVRLFERRAIAGGRAYSYRAREAGHAVDNGQHVMMGCYHRTLAFLDRTGARARLQASPRLSVPMVSPRGATGSFACAPLPSPFHLLVGTLGFGLIPPHARLRLLAGGARFVARRLSGRGLEGRTVAEALGELGQGQAERTAFWYPLAIAALNELPERAAASLFGEVLRRIFFARAQASSILFPRVGLSDLLIEPAVRAVEAGGGVVETGRRVRRLRFDDERISGVECSDGRFEAADLVIAAVPPTSLLAMLPEAAREARPFAAIARLRSSPIVSVHLWLRDSLPTPRMLGFLDDPIQWMFTPPMQPARGRYVTLVASGAHGLVDRPPEAILDVARRTLERHWPAARSAVWDDALVAKERDATWASAPAEQAWRPPARTPLRNLFLAGDWTDTGLPGTIEGAIVSGERAAGHALGS